MRGATVRRSSIFAKASAAASYTHVSGDIVTVPIVVSHLHLGLGNGMTAIAEKVKFQK